MGNNRTVANQLRREIEDLKYKLRQSQLEGAEWKGKYEAVLDKKKENQDMMMVEQRTEMREIEYLRELVRMLTVDPEKMAKFYQLEREAAEREGRPYYPRQPRY